MTNRSHTCIRPHRVRTFGRALLGAASAGLILAALLPLCTMGILNYGSLAIWAVAVPGLLIALFPRAARALCARLWAHTPGRVLLRTAAGLLAAALLYCTAVTGAMLWCCAQRPAADDDPPLIVLGCQVYAAGPSPMLTMRLRAAEKYLAAHPNAMAVVSGGQGDGEPHAEAEVMCDWLIAHGVAAERILTEAQSRNTEENIAFSAALLRENGWNGAAAAVATDWWHELRAFHWLRAAGAQPFAAPCRTYAPLEPLFFARELCGTVRLFFAGY